MYQLNNLFDNKNMKVIAQRGNYQVFEHERDLSVSPSDSVTAYFSSEMNVRKRQVLSLSMEHLQSYRQELCSGCWEVLR